MSNPAGYRRVPHAAHSLLPKSKRDRLPERLHNYHASSPPAIPRHCTAYHAIRIRSPCNCLPQPYATHRVDMKQHHNFPAKNHCMCDLSHSHIDTAIANCHPNNRNADSLTAQHTPIPLRTTVDTDAPSSRSAIMRTTRRSPS